MAIQVAVVGCWNIARAIHLPNTLKLPEYQLRLVVDADTQRARDTAEQFQSPDHSSSYDDALSSAEIDLVIICTPHNQHAQMAIQAVNAGKHVLVEKPMAMKLEELKPIVEAVRRQGVTFTVGFNRRYSEL
ncbi:MAG: Gfo/Idh/MocA family oxidoreductase, partial [Armatimonadetes bacterium]|nr:Gfo/Idh/MocA family oxidoreductase [Armatimonadota bacterium]